MAEEIARARWDSHRREIYAHEMALERTVPRYLAMAFGAKDIEELPPIPEYDDVIKMQDENGKIVTKQTQARTKYDKAKPEDTFVTHKWWEKKNTDFSNVEEITEGGAGKLRT